MDGFLGIRLNFRNMLNECVLKKVFTESERFITH